MDGHFSARADGDLGCRFEIGDDVLDRMDPAAVQRRMDGRPPAEHYLPRGIVFCGASGRALYTRRQAVGRVYVCSARREGQGGPSAGEQLSDDASTALNAVLGRG
jgi:hypothetical protein